MTDDAIDIVSQSAANAGAQQTTERSSAKRQLDTAAVGAPSFWTPDEDERLKRALEKFGRDWRSIGREFPDRSDSGCRNRANKLGLLGGPVGAVSTVPTYSASPAPSHRAPETTFRARNQAPRDQRRGDVDGGSDASPVRPDIRCGGKEQVETVKAARAMSDMFRQLEDVERSLNEYKKEVTRLETERTKLLGEIDETYRGHYAVTTSDLRT